MNFFTHLPQLPDDPIFGLTEEFKRDPRKEKWNLSIGVYRDESLTPLILNSVKMAERSLLEREKNKEYLPIDGSAFFLDNIGKSIFTTATWEAIGTSIAAIQTAGGTHALRLGGDFLKKYLSTQMLISDPAWPNHMGIFDRAGFTILRYPYYDLESATLEWEKIISTLRQALPQTVVLFQLCCHNPSGMTFNAKQWEVLADLTQEKGLIPFFDFAYQGFGQGFVEDAAALRPFIANQQEFLVAYSCSKNFSLYCERTGALFIITRSPQEREKLQSILKVLMRTNISNPPAHGARIVEEIFRNPLLHQQWRDEVEQMRLRLMQIRNEVAEELSLPHVKRAEGMFAYLHFPPELVQQIKDRGIYMTGDSRINLAALNHEVLAKLKDAIR